MQILFILSLIAAASPFKFPKDVKPLSDWHSEIVDEFSSVHPSNHFHYYIHIVDHEKMLEVMKFSENRHKHVNYLEAMLLILGSGIYSMGKSDKSNFWYELKDVGVDYYKARVNSSNLSCYESELLKLAPNKRSMYFEGTDSHRNETCEVITDVAELDVIVDDFEESFGSLQTWTRHLLDKARVKGFMLHLILLGNEDKSTRSARTLFLRTLLQNSFDNAFNKAIRDVTGRS